MSKQVITVAILGLDRWSASIGMALRHHGTLSSSKNTFTVVGQDAERSAMQAARDLEAVDSTQQNARSAIADADIVLLNLPIGVLDGVFEFISPSLKKGAVVLDMSPYKKQSIQLAKQYFTPGQAYWVGIQPLVNSAFLFDAALGVEHADKATFQDSMMIIAPQARCPEDAVKLAADLATILEMQPHFMTPEELDALTDFTENFPVLLGSVLFGVLRGDVERMVNPTLALLMHSLRNREAADVSLLWRSTAPHQIQRIDQLIGLLQHLRGVLEDETQIDELVKSLFHDFATWQGKRIKGDWEPSQPAAPTTSGLLAGMFGFGTKSQK